MNIIAIKGRLTRDPEQKQTQTGTSVAKFTVAVNRRFDKDKTADFFNCTAFGKTADFVIKYFNKGQEIVLSGRIENDKYQDKNGNNRDWWDIKVEQVDFCGPAKDKAATNNAVEVEGFTPIDDEDLPF
ncbi:MAG: single-stranded DNA-binding protein [Eubacteriales bacterium]|jgi:single-strand DNA-binding protein